jgi:ribosomal protein S15P/S13E
LSCRSAPENNIETEAQRRGRTAASPTSNLLEIVMLAFLFTQISHWFEHIEQHRNDEYLLGARDLVELERRMRSLERD